MVVDQSNKSMVLAREWLSAGLGCAIADSIFNPLEVLKVRKQLLQQSAYTPSTRELVVAAVKEEGGLFRGLWVPGLCATWMRGMSYTGFRIGLYPTVRDMYNRTLSTTDGGSSFAVKLLAGATTGVIGSAVFNPIDIVRIRTQAQTKSNPLHANTFAAFGDIKRKEGLVKGWWRGVGICMARAAFLSGSSLATYDAAKRYLLTKDNDVEDAHSFLKFSRDGPALHFTCAFISGVVAQTVTQPVDTLKTLIMSADGRARGTFAVFMVVLRESGIRGLYRGFWPAASRQGPVMVIQMPIVEQLRRFFGLDYF
eukprot:m.343924 g.343924  ORF g.343924 m.343924 type:complete len:310 (+) comp23554_c0_seq1:104-1033(+)